MCSNHLSEEPQSARGAQGSRDTGSDTPDGGSADRPAGTFDEEEVTSTRDHNPTQENIGGSGTLPPGDAEPAIPPYEGRRTSAEGNTTSSAGEGSGANTGGAGHPVSDPNFKAPRPEDTPGGATTSPADEQPASQASETEASDEGVEVGSHSGGVRRAEDQPGESRPK
ncbi:hypothetical protein EBN03_13815 [Nocardia stercoris]|uniref:Uncharacterized protein n=1 Tax=Nocardia stercoris TaxID=2483361 RepID=A0A3M2L6D6_9NOCA|nr:hypothetical protein EBN03_13815 [Nocardia stercoris]